MPCLPPAARVPQAMAKGQSNSALPPGARDAGPYAAVALPLPLSAPLTYAIPPDLAPGLQRGVRVRVPLGRREGTGDVVGFPAGGPPTPPPRPPRLRAAGPPAAPRAAPPPPPRRRRFAGDEAPRHPPNAPGGRPGPGPGPPHRARRRAGGPRPPRPPKPPPAGAPPPPPPPP